VSTQPGFTLSAAQKDGGALIAPPPAPGRRPGRRQRRQTAVRMAVIVLIGGYLLLPLLAMLDFSTRGAIGTRTLDAWIAIGSNKDLLEAIFNSLATAVLTVFGMLLLLVPTMTWTILRVPRMRRVVEFLCLLPLAIPAIVLVVGVAPMYRVVTFIFGGSALTLVFIDIILVLPFAYRALDAALRAIDVATLADAARSLGASWPRVIGQIVVPNIRAGILSASVLTVALVLGEFTISSLLNFDTLQVTINLIGKRSAYISVAVSLAALVFAFVLIYAIAAFAPGGQRGQAAAEEEE
jgi:putative spermidine/putrescine transport system permease protein